MNTEVRSYFTFITSKEREGGDQKRGREAAKVVASVMSLVVLYLFVR